ncbi:hypothetical protein [Tranquillimonas alkanivorans]|uniref:hypothetical protein n=1 Tax=Tranquillimonas alkanivorans TaxID=441119 RepID=UPI0011604385|nr:hypothetical protein [Tranquillimonas alkanivorans]
MLHSLVVENRGDRPLDNLEVVARAHPPVLAETRWTIDRIAAGSEVALRDLATRLDIERLARLDEAEVCELVLSVTTEDGHTEEQRHRLELLARDEWGGVNCPIRVVQVDC